MNEQTFFGNYIPLFRAKEYQEIFSNLLIFVTTADENLIHQSTTNTSILI